MQDTAEKLNNKTAINAISTPSLDTEFFALEIDETLEFLGSSKSGLSSSEAQERLLIHGKNSLPPPKKKPAVVRFLLQFHNLMVYVLIGAALLTLIMGVLVNPSYFTEMGVILGVIVINALIGFIQEGKAEKALEGIKKLLSSKANVWRDGSLVEIGAEDITIGDVVFLKAGDKISADMRILSASRLEVDEASLTGESVAASKAVAAVGAGTLLADRSSMVYAGTSVAVGDCTAVVSAVGVHTEVGKINKMLADSKQESTPLMKKMDFLSRVLMISILVLSAVLFLVGFLARGMEWDATILAVIGMAVAAVPEGLPSILTIIFAIGVQRMAQKNAIVRRMFSVETLGALTVICSDKTGTLTKNEMTATTVYTASGDFEVTGLGYAPVGQITNYSLQCTENDKLEMRNEKLLLENCSADTMVANNAVGADAHSRPPCQTHYTANQNPVGAGIDRPHADGLTKLLECCYICNESSVSEIDGRWAAIGAPTEAALKVLAFKGGLKEKPFTKLTDIPFDSLFKYRATLVEVDGKKKIFVTGAPEKLLELCVSQQENSGKNPLDRNYWTNKIEQGASLGNRLIATAYCEVDSNKTDFDHCDLKGTLTFLGLVAIIDPPREEVYEALKTAHTAGIVVKMITGDHALTAKAIAQKIGLTTKEKVLTGTELEAMTDEELKLAVQDCDIFARTTPTHKLRIVKALQANGEIVAMTGDGVNDAPALKKADIGIAMGIKGTEVTKEAAEVVLADDNFSTIITSVEKGRTIFDNIRKTLIFILPANIAQALVIVIAILAGFTAPISALQVLWVNMVVAITLSISLGFSGAEKNVMTRPPRPPKEKLIGGYYLFRMIFAAVLITAFTLIMFLVLHYGFSVDLVYAQTVAVNALVFAQLLFLFNCLQTHDFAIKKGFFKNKIAFIVSGILVLLQIGFTYIPFMNTAFETTFIGALNWLYFVAGGIAIFFIIELEKWIARVVFKKRDKKLASGGLLNG